jgi:hypothetical protein
MSMKPLTRLLAAACVMAAIFSGCNCGDPVSPGKPDASVQEDGGNTQPDTDGGTDGGQTDGGTGPDTQPVPIPGPTAPNNDVIDSDCDGLTDAEEHGNVYAGNVRTNPAVRDSDGDGVRDGMELGRTSTIDATCTIFIKDEDPSTKTHPMLADTDGDGLRDGEEDINRNGKKDLGETDAANRDSDNDALTDGVELNTSNTDPLKPDTDGDGCLDGAEDRNGNGVKDSGETSALDATDCGSSLQDSDGDGVPDATEVAYGTDKNNPDSDGDGLVDGVEDRNKNGQFELGETNPRKKDSDCDGLQDGPNQSSFKGEDLNANGVLNAGETNPANRDTDGDGLSDGVERGVATSAAPDATCGYAGDSNPTSTTDPTDSDSDNDGVADGAEDSNQNGGQDSGELNPNDPTDVDNTVTQACATPNLRQVTFKENSGADMRLALRPSFQEVLPMLVSERVRGYIGYDSVNKVSFIAFKRGQVGTSTTVVGDETVLRDQLQAGGTLTRGPTQTFNTWDGFPALLGYYEQTGAANLRDYTNALANTMVGSGNGKLTGGGDVTGAFKVQAQYVHRSNDSVVVVLAITQKDRFDNPNNYPGQPSLFSVRDTAGGTALAQFGDADAVQCEPFTSGTGQADFLFVVDDSGSMATSQKFLGNTGDALATRLATTTINWRIGLVTTGYTTSNATNYNIFRGYTTSIPQFKAWLQSQSANPPTPCPDESQLCWIGTSGTATEKSLDAARAAVNYTTNGNTPADKRYRPGAELVIILVTDTRDQSGDTIEVFTKYFQQLNPLGRALKVHGIICDPTGARCDSQEDNTNPRHLDVIQATGGVYGFIRSEQSIKDTINTVVDSVISSAGYRTLKPPIGASVKVSVAQVADPVSCPSNNDIPRSLKDGFDVDGLNRSLSFFGGCRPADPASTKAVVSYRYWRDQTTDPNGDTQPCATDPKYDPTETDLCDGPLVCNQQTNVCECTADCGGGCGSYQACNTTTCQCACVQSATCAPGFKFDAASCGCVCDTAALNCGSTYQADPNLCACICKDNCGGCPTGTTCNESTCSCTARPR